MRATSARERRARRRRASCGPIPFAVPSQRGFTNSGNAQAARAARASPPTRSTRGSGDRHARRGDDVAAPTPCRARADSASASDPSAERPPSRAARAPTPRGSRAAVALRDRQSAASSGGSSPLPSAREQRVRRCRAAPARARAARIAASSSATVASGSYSASTSRARPGAADACRADRRRVRSEDASRRQDTAPLRTRLRACGVRTLRSVRVRCPNRCRDPRRRPRASAAAWLLVALWAALVWWLGTDQFGAAQTSRYLLPLIDWLWPSATLAQRFALLMAIRKLAHPSVYARARWPRVPRGAALGRLGAARAARRRARRSRLARADSTSCASRTVARAHGRRVGRRARRRGRLGRARGAARRAPAHARRRCRGRVGAALAPAHGEEPDDTALRRSGPQPHRRPGAPFEVVTETVRGRPMKTFKNRERSLREKVADGGSARRRRLPGAGRAPHHLRRVRQPRLGRGARARRAITASRRATASRSSPTTAPTGSSRCSARRPPAASASGSTAGGRPRRSSTASSIPAAASSSSTSACTRASSRCSAGSRASRRSSTSATSAPPGTMPIAELLEPHDAPPTIADRRGRSVRDPLHVGHHGPLEGLHHHPPRHDRAGHRHPVRQSRRSRRSSGDARCSPPSGGQPASACSRRRSSTSAACTRACARR